jgi:peptidylglycine monooxygenase
LSKLAGVYLLGTGGFIPPHSTEHMETSCAIKEKKVIHPFAYRTHTHKLGKYINISYPTFKSLF